MPSSPPATHQPSIGEELFISFGRLLWAFRVELALLSVPTACFFWARPSLGLVGDCVLTALAVSLVVVFGPSRRFLWRLLVGAHWRRRFDRAVRQLDRRLLLDRPPRVTQCERVPGGVRVTCHLGPGTHVGDLELAAPAIEAALGVRSVRLVRDERHANVVRVSVLKVDPLAGDPVVWPAAGAPSRSAWLPVPIGVDEDGNEVTLSLPHHNLLVGGEPGSGKSVALSLVVATAALDPSTELTLIDGKVVELAPWKDAARRFCGWDIEQAIETLNELRSIMDDRYATLLERSKRKVELSDGLSLHVVVIDELALFCAHPDKKLAAAFSEALRDLVARGRAAGIVVVAATQKPSVDIVPSALRDLFGFRWALRCTTESASDTILGSGWASEGYSASTIPAATRGVGLLLAEGALPVRLRAYLLDDDHLGQLAHQAVSLRRAFGR